MRMAKPQVRSGGGFRAIAYVLRKGREAGGLLSLYRRLRSRNTCKTCALGMGGQRGGMVNEAGIFPEVCKKSVQAQAGDMAGSISEEFFAGNSFDHLSQLTSAQLERLGRLAFPIVAAPGDNHYRRIAWEEAMQRSAEALKAAPPTETFFYSSGRSSNEAAFLLQLVARAYGTANIHNCSYYCHAASGVALSAAIGTGTATVVLDDLAKADLALVAGANPASNHPRLITQLVNLRRRGGTVIVVNPIREVGLVRFRIPSDWRSLLFGSDVSDIYLQPHAGGDAALFAAVLKGVIEQRGIDQSFVSEHAEGWDELRVHIEGLSWDELIDASGVSRDLIGRTVAAIMRARRGIFLWAMGLTHHEHGVDNILSLINLGLARGWVGRPGCGFLPIRGHSNVQGVGSVGVTPTLKAAFAEKMGELYGIALPREPGQDTYASVAAASEGHIRACVLLGGNLFASNPDRAWAATSLQRIGTSIALTTKLNEGHIHGRGQTSIVLPVLARDEESQSTTQESMFNYVRFSDGGQPAVEGHMRSEVAIIAELAQRILPEGRFDWTALRSHQHLRHQIARVVPGYSAIETVDNGGGEFQIAGRTIHDGQFPTSTGRAKFHVIAVRAADRSVYPFQLLTLRSEGQFNTVVYEEEDLYRGNRRRDVVMMSSDDARKLHLNEADRVTVETEVGRMAASVALIDIRPGNLAMYYPEANAIVPRRLDNRSKTPAFKSIPARIVVPDGP